MILCAYNVKIFSDALLYSLIYSVIKNTYSKIMSIHSVQWFYQIYLFESNFFIVLLILGFIHFITIETQY